MPRNQERSVLFRKPRSGKDFVIVGVLIVVGAVVGNIIAALRHQDTGGYLADTLPLTLAAATFAVAVVLGVIWWARKVKDRST